MSKSNKGFLTANKLRQDLGIAVTECVDLDYVADKLSIRVKRMDLGIGIEGACKSKGVKRLVVLTPNPSSFQKERFTFSHEIGHLLIHHSSNVCVADYFNTYKTQNDEEQEANDFAAELLLPQRAMTDILAREDLSFQLLERVATLYKTSLSVAAIRLTQIFNDNAVLVWHNGHRITWKIKSSQCYLKISDVISSMALAHKTNKTQWNIKGNIDPNVWTDSELGNWICEEETHFFSKIKMYLTILKFYEDG